ncbi:MAG: lipid-A-disaccharide synthase [Pseudomonadota bacterium]
MKIMIVAIEPSADAIGAAFMASMADQDPDVSFFGCGGAQMGTQGLVSAFPVEDFAVMGFSDVAGVYFKARRAVAELTKLAEKEEVDAVVFVDGWAFSRLCAERLKRHVPAIKRYKLVAPQVWASRPQRMDFVKAHFDGVLTLYPFEAPLFSEAGVPARFFGNPNFQTAFANRGDSERFRAHHGVFDEPLLALLVGSRRHEVKRHLELFVETAKRVRDDVPRLKIVLAPAPPVADLTRDLLSALDTTDIDDLLIFASPEEKFDAFAAADAALAVSGTVSTELAINATPMVVAYMVDPLTAYWARRVMTAKYVSMVNIALDEPLIPEIIQEDATTENLADALLSLLLNPEAADHQRLGFERAIDMLEVDGPPAAEIAATQILQWIRGS